MIIYIMNNKEEYLDIIKEYAIKNNYNKEIEIIKNKYGKPYIKDNPFYYNISHSYSYNILVISNQEIGIDIEKHRKINNKIINKYYSKEEQQEVINNKDAFYDIWCKKESYTKLIGNSIFNIINSNIKMDCLFYKIDIDNDYSCFVAVKHKEKEIVINNR